MTGRDDRPRLTLLRPGGPPLVVGQRDLVAIVGDSGAGKTTLLESLQAEVAERRRSGSKAVERSINGRWIIHAATWRAAQPVVVVPQENELVYAGLRTADNIITYQEQLAHDSILTPEDALELVRLDDALLRDRKAGRLSSGEKRRLLLAMDLALQPAVLAADEPLSQLDSSSADWVFQLLLNYAREVGPVLLTVHRPIDRWIERCTQVWIVERNLGVTVAMPGPAFLDTFRGLWRENKHLEPKVASPEGLVEVWRACGFEGRTTVPIHGKSFKPRRPPAVHYVLEHLDAFKRACQAGPDRAAQHVPGGMAENGDSGEGRKDAAPPGTSADRSDGRPAGARWFTAFRHELVLQSNLKFWKYWLLVVGLITLVFATNFLGEADRLPFSITRTSVALLVATLFISTVNAARLWVDHEADRIRQRCLRGMNPFVIAASRLVPGMIEGGVFAGLVFLVWWLLSGRLDGWHWLRHAGVQLEGDVGLHTLWPDGLATFSGLTWLPVLVPLLVYVSTVGCLQGMAISLWVGRRQLVGRHDRTGGSGFIPGAGQVSAFVAALVVVAQIFLSGAFGHITATGGSGMSRVPSSVLDWLAGLSPVRWSYNAVVMQEWRQARCSVAKTPCRYGSWYAPTFIQGCLDSDLLSRYTGADSNRLEIRTLDRDEVTDASKWWACDERKAGAWYVPVGELENIDASDAVRKWVTLRDLGAPIPIELVAEQVGANQFDLIEVYRRKRLDAIVVEAPISPKALAMNSRLSREFPLDRARGFDYLEPQLSGASGGERAAGSDISPVDPETREAVQDLLCASRHAFLQKDLELASTLVERAMIRPLLVDVEYCWQTCPRLTGRGLASCSDEALDRPLRYPAWTGGERRCADEPLEVFLATRREAIGQGRREGAGRPAESVADRGGGPALGGEGEPAARGPSLRDLVQVSCAETLFPLSLENRQLLFNMAVVLLVWAASILVLTERWYRALGMERLVDTVEEDEA